MANNPFDMDTTERYQYLQETLCDVVQFSEFDVLDIITDVFGFNNESIDAFLYQRYGMHFESFYDDMESE